MKLTTIRKRIITVPKALAVKLSPWCVLSLRYSFGCDVTEVIASWTLSHRREIRSDCRTLYHFGKTMRGLPHDSSFKISSFKSVRLNTIFIFYKLCKLMQNAGNFFVWNGIVIHYGSLISYIYLSNCSPIRYSYLPNCLPIRYSYLPNCSSVRYS